ncbi:MAG: tetratricopeptide repeat protein, partial [Candidatus Eisenbacteria bacterium]|nr:tetratricopeptide repeat protein [Candidatus Eisenbacteria bacterium]
MSNSAPNFARVAVLISIVAVAVLAGTAAAATRDPHARLLARIDSLYAKGRAETATALLDSLVTSARATGDRSLDAAMTSRRASVHMYFRRYADAIRDAEHAIGIARARRDSLTWSRALLAKGRVLMFQERPAAALPVYRELMRVSRNLDRPGLQGNARLGLAFLDLQEGRLVRAERGYRAAVLLLSGGVDIGGELSAKVGLARTLRAQGKPRDAQVIYRDVIRRAIEVGDLRDQADAWNNLGAIEVRSGSRSRATSYFQRALECYRRIGLPTGTPTTNLALLLLEQHRY